ncbi:MAG: CRISPR-associated protein Cas7 [Dysgonamonadaceae bacterium]|nr:CRISPR-associated protein Cas7 [Dysgonamonadaceae bacterium]MDD4729067.1 CRISPR-associated protein Cas7 [Dysgonamonadaceae bacterium]
MKSPFIYLRGLRHVDHTVFAVSNGQKYYYDSQFNKKIAYSSGQQVKRSIIEGLNLPFAAITFNWVIDKKGEAGQKEPHSPCDPSFADQLIGGYMKAESGQMTVKRRSPLSISAMRPVHPLLGGLEGEKEPIVFDRSNRPEKHIVKVSTLDEKGNRVEIPSEELEEWLSTNRRSLGPKYYNNDNNKALTRASGLFVYDIAIDLRTLFCVSTNKLEPELFPEIEEKLRKEGWKESENIFGRCLICPKKQREEIIKKLAHSLINWRITSNQSRTFSPMETLAVAISDNANQITFAIRGELRDDTERPTASPKIDKTAKASIFVTPVANAYIQGEIGSADALEKAEQKIFDLIMAYDYEREI